MHNPFTSLSDFRTQFNLGLCQLLDKKELGTFILCLANASNDSELFTQLRGQLEYQYLELLEQYKSALLNGEQINAVDEDLLVFLKLNALGFHNVKLTEKRDESVWLCQFNQLRSFRPSRMTKFAHNGKMLTPYIESHFNFNKPFMAKECFWSGLYNNKQIDLFYNKYPFANIHGLIVPQRDKCLPQFLLKDMHSYICKFTNDLSENLPGIAVGYNSYGAYASVNHLHFQMVIDEKGLPVSHSSWRHNGGNTEYPLNVIVCESAEDSWKIIDDLHNQKQAFNLLYMPEKIYIIPRAVQGSVDVADWSSGFTWYEMCGAMLLSNYRDYTSLQDSEITEYLKSYKL
ncbi:MAG: hypothetical protein OQK98_12285 [Gammaproteobacteria bacterium]|nr:hypothetical protein [Gammaproteobacteria bacterium]